MSRTFLLLFVLARVSFTPTSALAATTELWFGRPQVRVVLKPNLPANTRRDRKIKQIRDEQRADSEAIDSVYEELHPVEPVLFGPELEGGQKTPHGLVDYVGVVNVVAQKRSDATPFAVDRIQVFAKHVNGDVSEGFAIGRTKDLNVITQRNQPHLQVSDEMRTKILEILRTRKVKLRDAVVTLHLDDERRGHHAEFTFEGNEIWSFLRLNKLQRGLHDCLVKLQR